MSNSIICDNCVYYSYDEDYEEYICDMNMDEDDYSRILQNSFKECPYYIKDDEYKVVRHQM